VPRSSARSKRSDRSRREKDSGGWYRSQLLVLQRIGWGPRDAVACLVGVVAAVAILVNALFLQSGPHPAPLFKMTLASIPSGDATNAVTVPRPRPPEPLPAKTDAPAAARPLADTIADIQRELARRGFYDGTADGAYGPKTVSAVRDFEQAAGLKPSSQASEALLQTIVKSGIMTAKARAAAAAPAPARNDAIAEMLGPSKRVIAVQRALADFGYGQIKPTGIIDAETRAAIEKFERERNLPVTGQPSDRMTKELTSVTGRSFD
jgi:peptidoglycan hydrolase-like protein with peptidoglycan-binding domain